MRIMTRLFRSKSCTLPSINRSPDSSWEPKKSNPSQYDSEQEEEDEDDEDEEEDIEAEEDTMEEEEEEEEEEEVEYLRLRNSNNNSGGDTGEEYHHPLLAIVLAALRKSLLVTCSVERDDVDDDDDGGDVSKSKSNQLDISWPTDVHHVSHVTFDPFNGFLGLPLDLQYDLPPKVPSASASVFGVSAQSMQCSYDDRGNCVPTILLMMQNRLYSEGGLQAEGIFRINAENSQEEGVRKQLNKGVVPHGIDVHCLAGLIKAWFRELPTGILDCLTPEQVMHCNTEEECVRLVNLLPSTEAGLLDWAINLMADVVLHEHYNKMNARNIAMVFAPNMTQMADPLTALIHAVQVMNFLKTLINKTLREREETRSSDLGVIMQCDQAIDNQIVDRLESDSVEKWNFRVKGDTDKVNEFIPDRIAISSPILCKSQSNLESCYREGKNLGDEEEEADEEGILDKLGLRKRVRKLCKHPMFQLNRPVKKKTDTGILNSKGAGEAWI
ncbi:OLC1v1037349C2 [Oldenlandia corymbosa var. corymbosa]|uniref:OLC1v1037349C2 n=1 Tax=Oldenlandia corymbosa var. corymbosa TaxID=529605 RepID=A0AAV1CYU6_OLDCO|nr:OLC1v1037349C2 [Oldenlandia corymbosa var. corymbosa]